VNEHSEQTDNPAETSEPLPPLPPPKAGRTLKFGIRAAWDALGFVCAMSLTIFLTAIPSIGLLVKGLFVTTLSRLVTCFPAAVLYLLTVPPVYAGVCWLTHLIIERDEPSYAEIWRGATRMYGRAVALGAIHLVGTLVLVGNTLFYLRLGGFVFILLAVLFLYALLFWGMNLFYHWPLLIAMEAGILKRDDGGQPGLRSVFRNGFLLAFSAPAFTFILVAVIMAMSIPLIISGAGLALIAPGFIAFLTTQATRDQLVRFHLLPEPPDPDEPIEDTAWRVR
jgi:hypothetical protein